MAGAGLTQSQRANLPKMKTPSAPAHPSNQQPTFGGAADEMVSGNPSLGVKFAAPKIGNPIAQVGGMFKGTPKPAAPDTEGKYEGEMAYYKGKAARAQKKG